MQELGKKWEHILNTVPDADPLGTVYHKAAAGDKFDKFGEFGIVNRIAKDYGYTHAEVFDLSWRLAYTIMSYDKTQSYVEFTATKNKSDDENR
jgi:hypothetical protein